MIDKKRLSELAKNKFEAPTAKETDELIEMYRWARDHGIPALDKYTSNPEHWDKSKDEWLAGPAQSALVALPKEGEK